jgi:hypothetical protein
MVFCSFSYWAGRGGAGTRPFFKTKPASLTNPNGFGKFQPEPAKIGTQIAQIEAGQIGLVGLGGLCPLLAALMVSFWF